MPISARIDDGRVWTPEELDKLEDPEGLTDLDWRRLEIVDGALVVHPFFSLGHSVIRSHLAVAMHGRTPDGYIALGGFRINLHPTYRVTDGIVVRWPGVDKSATSVPPDEVLLAIEIESPHSITTDRITKPAEYAAAGIPHFWRLETDPLRLNTYRLINGTYELVSSWDVGETARITDPFEVEIELSSLLP